MRYYPQKIESKWQKKWLTEKTYEPDFRYAKKPFYNLMMFPYPSAEGLHIGGMRTFTGVDIYGRFKRMQGYDVFEPIGLDAFGINSENYALKTGRHPMKQATILEKNFYRQLAAMGNGFAWRERLETNDPDYYQWTQWIFVTMFKHGLAYRKKQAVNWCPSCKTVLADEQVVGGKCERCGTMVIQKELEQWFFCITKYAERLLKNLEKIDWSERVKIAQRNWIGKSEGAVITFPLVDIHGQEDGKHSIEIFTTRPDTIFGATFIVISPERGRLWLDIGWQAPEEVRVYIAEALGRRLLPEDKKSNDKTGVFSGVSAINPANKEKIPMWIADYVLSDVGTGAIMAVPAHDQRDFEFAKKYKLSIRTVIIPKPLQTIVRNIEDIAIGAKSELRVETECWEGGGDVIDSGKFTGFDSEDAKWEITEFVGGKRTVQYRLRDWLISRQRYWGPPIPMIFCDSCAVAKEGERKEMPGWYAVPEKNLPVKLPFIKNFRPTGTDQSPLASIAPFYKVRCPRCKKMARRETDVSDTFLDSAWYFLRYPSVKDKKAAWDPAIMKKWLPVDSYIGGAEHSVLHLMYARFLTMALHDAKLLHFEEPFPKFRAHGLITKDGAKMSKSKGNVVNPDDYIRIYGRDAVRMYLAFLAPFDQGGDFRDTGIRGITRFLERVWKFFAHRAVEQKNRMPLHAEKRHLLKHMIHKTIQKVTDDIETLHYNTAISALMILLNTLEEYPEAITNEYQEIFLKLLAPFAPHVTEELWQQIHPVKKFASIHHEPWPKFNPRFTRDETFELVVQVNGKIRGRITLPMGSSENHAVKHACALKTVKPYLSGKPRKAIFIPNRLINFVM
ncbi:MAG: leucyl-tRNA synthetase [Parcubacteria group bacterium Gr01-1014_66]|nr:MAG: leucyl-tRNA synthetase [Parcubacteria group bacterium Gr01-1014_66]